MKCRDKKAYQGRQEAEQALKDIKSEPDYDLKSRKERRAYKCDACGLWHLTAIGAKLFNIILEKKRVKKIQRIDREAEYWARKNNWSHE